MKNATDITLVIDRSGSMEDIRLSAENGINGFIKEQKAVEGECKLSLVHFDNHYEVIHDGIDIKNVPHYTLEPRGGTALNDAVGKTINDIGRRLSKLAEKDRPDKVIVVIVTDGMENASREFGSESIKSMVERQKNVYNWQFVYLGANQDAKAVGGELGFSNESYTFGAAKYGAAMNSTSKSVTQYRSGNARSVALSAQDQKDII